MRGRKPKPTALRVLQGNPGKRPFNRFEPKAAPLSEECPDELAFDDERDEWARTIAPAIRIGQVSAGDRCAAIAHCVQWATWRSQVVEANKHAHVIGVGPQKHPMPNPARTMANKTLQLLLKIDAELGLTPVSRARVQTSGAASDDDERQQLARLLAIH